MSYPVSQGFLLFAWVLRSPLSIWKRALIVGCHGLKVFLSSILAPFSDESFNETTIHYNMDKVMENDRRVRRSNGKNPKALIGLQGPLERGATKV